MGIFDSFTGGASARAEGANRAIQWDTFKDVTGISRDAYNQGRQDISTGRELFWPLYGEGMRQMAGFGLYGDALGANGQAGNDRARAAFMQAPGMSYQVNTTLDDIMRRGAAMGGGALGGNVLTEMQSRGQDLYRQGWGDWMTHLANMDARNRSTGATLALGGAGGLYGGSAALAGLGSEFANREANFRQANANAIAGSNTRQAQAEAQGNANLWSAAMNGVKMLAGMPSLGGGFSAGGGGMGNPLSTGNLFGV